MHRLIQTHNKISKCPCANITGWKVTRVEYYDIVMDTSMCGIELMGYMELVPNGTFMCDACGKNTRFDDMSSYITESETGADIITCYHCTKNKHAIPMIRFETEKSLHMIKTTCADYNIEMEYHVKPVTAEKKQKCLDNAKKIAEECGLIYMDGLTTTEIHKKIMAKRVLSRWMQFAHTRLINKLAYTLYTCVDLDKHTSTLLSQQALAPLHYKDVLLVSKDEL